MENEDYTDEEENGLWKEKLRKAFFYLFPPVVMACIIGGIYLSQCHPKTQEEDNPAPRLGTPANPSRDSVSTEIPGNATVENAPANDVGDNAGGVLDTAITKTVLTIDQLMERAPEFSSSPIWTQLLAQTTPVTRIVKAIDAVANGQRPMEALDYLHVDTTFTARQNAEGNWVATADTYARYQDAVDFLVATPTEKIAEWFEMAEPVLQQSCRQLGYQDKSIRDLLAEAIQTILEVPQFSTDPVLVPTGTTGTYHFVDPAFEQLNDAQKLLVRLGPENCAKIQDKCRAISDALKLGNHR